MERMAMRRLFILFVYLLSCYSSHSQSVTPFVLATKGEYFSNTTYSLSWTLGQVASTTLYTTSNIVSQGFQQPWYSTIGISELTSGDADINIYPNPATNIITVTYSTENRTNLKFEIIDLLGKKIIPDLVKHSNSDYQFFELSLEDITAGMFFIRIISMDSKIIKSCKIIKLE